MKRFVFSISLFTTVTFCFSQQLEEIIAQGKITDAATGKGVVAKVTYKSLPTGSIRGTFMDSTYAFDIFGTARYQVTAEAAGFNPQTVIVDPKEADGNTLTKDVVLTGKGKTVRLNNLIFALGKSTIDPQSYAELDEVAALMNDNKDMVIQLEGHTDNVGNANANIKLSQKRVDAVKSYLVSKGIQKSRIKTKAFGGSQPLSNEMTPEARTLNRRVEMRILED